MIKSILLLILFLLMGLACLYFAAFFAWVTATPASPVEILRARRLFMFCTVGAAISTAGFLATAIHLFRVSRR